MPKVASSASGLSNTWVLVVGAVVGVLTLLFFMALVLLGIFGREVPCNSVFLTNVTLSLGAALAASFLGGNAVARGNLTIPGLQQNPFAVSVGGGVAVLFIMLVLTSNLFGRESCGPAVAVSCPIGFQANVVEPLRFGFCYPREGWELDTGPIGVNAADIYLRNSTDRDVGLHFHISLIPTGWANKPSEYTAEVVKTWSQLDQGIQQSKTFVGGRDAYVFSLKVMDRKGRVRPTEITHIYLDPERLLEIIETRLIDTASSILDDMQKVRSSLVFARV